MYRLVRKEYKPYRAAWLTRMLMNDIVPSYYEKCITISVAEEKLRKLHDCILNSKNCRKDVTLHLEQSELLISSRKNRPYLKFSICPCKYC